MGRGEVVKEPKIDVIVEGIVSVLKICFEVRHENR